MKNTNDLSNLKYTFITGASAGIGKETALQAARKGHALVLTARRMDRLLNIQKECLASGSPSVLVYELDVRNPEAVQKIAEEFTQKKVQLKVLVNSAGLAVGYDPMQNADTQGWDLMIDTNVKGLLYVTRALIPFLISSRGHIVNIGSASGRFVYSGGSVYCATKFAVRAITEGLRMDLLGTGLRVTNIEPGLVNTEFNVVRLGNQQKSDAVYEGMMPLLANDIAETILWCVERPAHVNIQELLIYPTDQAAAGQVARGDKSIKNLTNT